MPYSEEFPCRIRNAMNPGLFTVTQYELLILEMVIKKELF